MLPRARVRSLKSAIPFSPASEHSINMSSKTKPIVIVAGLGDTGALIATRLSRTSQVIGISTRPALLSGQELGNRLTEPDDWRKTYLVPYRRFRKLDGSEVIHGRIASVDLDAKSVTIESADGATRSQRYDFLVIATGASNGFWRNDRVEDLATVENGLVAVNAEIGAASTIAVIGGGATGISVADNLARAGGAEVHLFHSGSKPLPGYHPKVRSWIGRVLTADGVTIHPDHRAIVPEGFNGDRLTHEPVAWSTGQSAFAADVTIWAVGGVRPHSGFLPPSMLDDEGFILVDDHLRLPGHPEVYAVGDVAASDPLRSSARNWGYRVVVANLKATIAGKPKKLETYSAPEYRWGSLLGMQSDGLTVVQPNGKRFRIPRWIAKPLLLNVFVERILYGGLRSR
jgi:NADH dehydrogenase FAD-containing subunit